MTSSKLVQAGEAEIKLAHQLWEVMRYRHGNREDIRKAADMIASYASEGRRETTPLDDLVKQMGDAGYCNYEACREFLEAAYLRGRAEQREELSAFCQHRVDCDVSRDVRRRAGEKWIQQPCSCGLWDLLRTQQ